MSGEDKWLRALVGLLVVAFLACAGIHSAISWATGWATDRALALVAVPAIIVFIGSPALTLVLNTLGAYLFFRKTDHNPLYLWIVLPINVLASFVASLIFFPGWAAYGLSLLAGLVGLGIGYKLADR